MIFDIRFFRKTHFALMMIALSLVSRAPAQTADEAPRVGRIDPAEEAKFSTRYKGKYSRIFSFGPALGVNLNQNEMLYGVTLGGQTEVGPQGAVLAQIVAAMGDRTGFYSGILGGKYFFSDGDVCPMIKGGFGLGVANGRDAEGVDIKAVGGFVLNAGAGITLFRTSSVHMELAAEYTLLLKANEMGNPGFGAVTLGVQF